MNFPEFFGVPANHQKTLVLILISLIISTNSSHSQSSPNDDSFSNNSPDSVTNFQPSLAVVIGVLSIMFSLTFLLLIYAKCCHRSSSNHEIFGNLPTSRSRFSGIDKTVIESLPFFRFSTLKGWRDGLECSVCLSKFEDIEILRFLPKCKHAFHIDCVDQWLEKHSSCPLCRCKVSEEDVALFTYSNSLRFLRFNESDDVGDQELSNIELFVEREGSTRFGSGRSFRSVPNYVQENNSLENQEILEKFNHGRSLNCCLEDEEILHKFNHRIMVSNDINRDHDSIMMMSRWSNVSSSDLMVLKSEMITSMSSNRFDHHPSLEIRGKYVNDRKNDQNDGKMIKIKEEMGRKREIERKIEKFPGGGTNIERSLHESKTNNSIEKRSMSEIILHPRFLDVEREDNLGEVSVKAERLRRLWLPIARRTVQWFANRERRRPASEQPPHINTKLELSLHV